ncbi:hypothetical protein [Ferriphaselus sp. R-1]|uniref:hypothetical protein n=1 Tax=Ferriphaselus sp. R-1 TaxID=1485544 RepID=UPI000551663B|nr:hypothetical protein [Ferriphaselus sp. R-1]
MSRDRWFTDLRGGLLPLLLAMLAASALALFGQYRVENARQELQTAQQRLTAAHHALAAARDDQLIMPIYAALYRGLQQQQVIRDSAPDFRTLIEAQRPLALELHYTLSPALAEPGVGPFALMRHPLHLQLELLHEARLLELLDGLRATGWFMLDRCTLQPGEQALHADCTGSWLTLERHASP